MMVLRKTGYMDERCNWLKTVVNGWLAFVLTMRVQLQESQSVG
jgi:hypothetical protein